MIGYKVLINNSGHLESANLKAGFGYVSPSGFGTSPSSGFGIPPSGFGKGWIYPVPNRGTSYLHPGNDSPPQLTAYGIHAFRSLSRAKEVAAAYRTYDDVRVYEVQFEGDIVLDEELMAGTKVKLVKFVFGIHLCSVCKEKHTFGE